MHPVTSENQFHCTRLYHTTLTCCEYMCATGIWTVSDDGQNLDEAQKAACSSVTFFLCLINMIKWQNIYRQKRPLLPSTSSENSGIHTIQHQEKHSCFFFFFFFFFFTIMVAFQIPGIPVSESWKNFHSKFIYFLDHDMFSEHTYWNTSIGTVHAVYICVKEVEKDR